MNYESAKQLRPRQFRRRLGVCRSTFDLIVKALQSQLPEKPGRGRKPKLCLEDRALVALEYWREYRSYFHIATDWQISESTVCRIVHWVEDSLMRSGLFRLPGKKRLVQGFERPDVVVMDVTETPIERPKRKQRHFYSGKKKLHTVRSSILTHLSKLRNVCRQEVDLVWNIHQRENLPLKVVERSELRVAISKTIESDVPEGQQQLFC